VLPGRRVEYEQRLIDRAVLLHDALHLAQLVHEPDLVLQPAGGVDQYRVHTSVDTPFHGVVCHGGRIAALLAAYDLGTDATGPRRELLDGGGAERVGRTEHD